MDGLYFQFPHTVTVPCLDEDLAGCLAKAWDFGACGEDWVWCWADCGHLRISFRREADSLAFLAGACLPLNEAGGAAMAPNDPPSAA